MNSNSDMSKKRVREADSVPDSAGSKRGRVDSDESTSDLTDPPLCRVDSGANSSESGLDSAEARILQDDLLSILDSSDSFPAIQGLDSVIKSFEDEINVPGESQPELGYLLEASDDELGLPPTDGLAGGGGARIEAADFEAGSDGVVVDGIHGALFYEDEIPSYDSFGFGIAAEPNDFVGDSGSDYVALGGLFDGWDGGYENGAVLWRTESLPAS